MSDRKLKGAIDDLIKKGAADCWGVLERNHRVVRLIDSEFPEIAYMGMVTLLMLESYLHLLNELDIPGDDKRELRLIAMQSMKKILDNTTP